MTYLNIIPSRCPLGGCPLGSSKRAWEKADFGSPARNRKKMATGKYGCREVRVYPTECGEQLGRDPSKNGKSKSLVLKGFFWGGNTLGLVPSCRPHSLGYACTFYAPTSPPLKKSFCYIFRARPKSIFRRFFSDFGPEPRNRLSPRHAYSQHFPLHNHRVLQEAAQRGGAILLHVCGSPGPFFHAAK